MSAKRLCVVVGAGPGLGGSVARKFAKEGFRVALLNRSEASAKPTLAKITEEGGEALFVACDATDEASVARAFEELGPADCLVYNASAGFPRKTVQETTAEDLLQSFRVNTLGCMLTAQQVLPSMVKRKDGTILITSATAAWRGSAKAGAFTTAKFAQRALAETLAKEHASDGIHVALIRIDCGLDIPKLREQVPEEKWHYFGDTDQIAETYYFLYQQTACKRGWSNVVDIRPQTENWTY